METRSRSKYPSTSGQAGTSSSEAPVAAEATAGEPLDTMGRALPEGDGYRRETGALEVQTASPAPLSEASGQLPFMEEDDDRPYTTVIGRGSRGLTSPTPSTRYITENVIPSPSGPEMFPRWFGEDTEPNESLGDVTVMNTSAFPVKDSQLPAENASVSPSERSPQVPQLHFEDFAAEVIAGLDGLDPQTREIVRSRMDQVYGYPIIKAPISTANGANTPEYLTPDSPHVRFTAAEKGKFRHTTPPMPENNNGIYIAPDPDSAEGQITALRESDRRFAMNLQEQEDVRVAKATSAMEQAVQQEEEGNTHVPVLNPPSPLADRLPPITPRRAPLPSATPSIFHPSGNSARRNQDVIKENASRTRNIPVISTPAAVPPSRQIPQGTFLSNRMASSEPTPTPRGVPPPNRNPAPPRQDPGDPYDSSSSSDSDTSSADSNASLRTRKRKRSKQKERKRKLASAKLAASMKLPPPRKWDGNPSIDLFEDWLFELTEYYKAYQIPERMKVSTMANFLEGKARRTYMSIVAPTMEEWTMDQVSTLFFDQLFPPNIRQILRKRFEGSYQGSLTARAWAQRVKDLAARITDVSPEAKARQFWRGARPYVRIEWAGLGYSEEFSTFEELQEAAERIERQELQQRAERNETNHSNIRSAAVQTPESSQKRDSHKRNKQPYEKHAKKTNERPKYTRDHRKDAPKQSQPKSSALNQLSPKEREEHRASGKCFDCHETGHLARDCPSRVTAKAPRLGAGAVSFAMIDAQVKDVSKLGCGSLRFEIEDPGEEVRRNRGQLICSWAENELEDGLNGDTPFPDEWIFISEKRFVVVMPEYSPGLFRVEDTMLDIEYHFTAMDLYDEEFDIVSLGRQNIEERRDEWAHLTPGRSIDKANNDGYSSESSESFYDSYEEDFEPDDKVLPENPLTIAAYAVGASAKGRARKQEGARHPSAQLERNAAKTKDFERMVPKTCVINAFVNDNAVRVLVDTGSMSDFISTTLVDQLKITSETLARPLTVQLAVTGSRGKIHSSATAQFRYEDIDEQRRFDVMNIDGYDLILGTPFLFQHKGIVGFNPTRFGYGSKENLPFDGAEIARISSMAAKVLDENLDRVRELLRKEASDLCKSAEETPLPPFRAINHRIPLKDEELALPYIPSRCPQAFREQWEKKRDTYLRTGRWRYATGPSAVPMLFIPKKPGPNGEKRLRTVFAKQRLNDNTVKLSSPLPDIQTILETIASYRHKSLIDGRDAYEQIRVESKDVWKTLFNTPDGTMVSEVMQQGDANAGATYQTLMNHIFAPYIGVFMFVYLDDIIIFSNSVEEHVKHIRLVLEVLRREKLYLTSNDKLQFFANPLIVLGHVIDDRGIRMDPHKVDRIANWKVPTNASLVAGFTGMVQYLARDCHNVAKPLAVLSKIQGIKPWRWGPTEQRAFEEVKKIVTRWRENSREAINRKENAAPIGVHVDASNTGAGGVIWQGEDVEKAKIIAFWSGKFNSAEQNYPVHERELLGIVSTLKKYSHLLYGTKFTVYTDHKPLEHFLKQKTLSPRQRRWLDLLSHFDFDIQYIRGEDNEMADALSRMYSNEAPGVVRSATEYVTEPEDPSKPDAIAEFFRQRIESSTPLYTGDEVKADLELFAITRGRAAAVKAAAEGVNKETSKTDQNSQENQQMIVQARRPRNNLPKEPELSEPDSEGEPEIMESNNRSANSKTRPEESDISQASNGDERDNDEGENEMDTAEAEVESDKRGTPPDPPANANPPAIPILSEAETLERNLAPSLTYVIAEGEPEVHLPDCLKDRYPEDRFFAPIYKDPTQFKHYALEDGLLFLKDDGRRLLCVPDIKIGERRIREIFITHAHSILAHLGSKKTLRYLRDNVWWKEIQSDVTDYCLSCPTCASTKPATTHPFGMLRTLEVPSRPWQAIGIDFVGPLPSSSNRNGSFDMICVVIDHLTSMIHLIPSRQNYKAKDVAEMIFEGVYKLHGLPERIVSDRDSYFTSTFWDELHKLIGVELRLSTSFHPQTDGATERANRTMTTMLRQAVAPHQKDWVPKLPAIEFALNLARSETTGYSPFFLNSGQMPRPLIWHEESEYPGVRKHAELIRSAIMSAHDSILSARVKQTTAANKHRRPAPFTEGDLVYLSTKNLTIPKKRARKLVPKYIGPFRIIKVIEPGSTYRLDLPDEMKQRGLHPSFHASLLRIHIPNDDRKFPGRSISHITGFGKPTHWPVDRIVSHYGIGKQAIFEILWKSGDRSWEMYSGVKDLAAFDSYCEALGITSIGALKKGKGVPPDDPQIRNAVSTVVLNEVSAEMRPRPSSPSPILSLEMTGHLDEVDYSDSPIYFDYPNLHPVTSDPAPAAEATQIALETTSLPAADSMESDPTQTDVTEDAFFDPAMLLPALYMDDLPFSQASVSPQVLEALTNRIIILEARVSSYETIINNAAALRNNQPTQDPMIPSPVPLSQRISLRQRRATRESMTLDTSNGRRRTRREVARAQADHRTLVERIQNQDIQRTLAS